MLPSSPHLTQDSPWLVLHRVEFLPEKSRAPSFIHPPNIYKVSSAGHRLWG